MKWIFLIGYFTLCYVHKGVAQPAQALYSFDSFSEILAEARQNNPDLRIYFLEKQQAISEYKTSRSYRYPSINGSFSGQNNLSLATTPLPGEIFGQPGETINAQFGQEYTYNTGILISKELLNWQSNINSKIANMSISLAESQADAYEQVLKEQVALYYYTALVAQHALLISKRDLATADSITQFSLSKLTEGLITQLAYNQSLINVNTVKQQLVDSNILVDQCHYQLKLLLGLSLEDKIQLTEKLNLNDNKANYPLVSSSLSPDLSLAISEQQLEQARLRLNYQKAAYLPTLTLNFYFGQQQFRDNFGLSFGNNTWNNYSYLSLSLNIPIFSGFAKRHQVNTAKVGYEIAQRQLEDLQRSSQLNDDWLFSNYYQTKAKALTLYDNYKLFEDNNRLTFQTFNEGLISLDSYLSSFEDYLQAEQIYLGSLSELYTQYAQLISRTE